MAFRGPIILDSMKVTSPINFPMRVKVLIFINKDVPYNYKSKICTKNIHVTQSNTDHIEINTSSFTA